MEVRKDGTIVAARALKTDIRRRRVSSAGAEATVQDKRLYFNEIADGLKNVARFTAGAYTLLGRTGEEMEVVFGFLNCEGHDALFEGQDEEGPYLPRQQYYAYADLTPDRTTGEIPAEQLQRLLRDASRFFGVSLPDDHFQRYVR